MSFRPLREHEAFKSCVVLLNTNGSIVARCLEQRHNRPGLSRANLDRKQATGSEVPFGT